MVPSSSTPSSITTAASAFKNIPAVSIPAGEVNSEHKDTFVPAASTYAVGDICGDDSPDLVEQKPNGELLVHNFHGSIGAENIIPPEVIDKHWIMKGILYDKLYPWEYASVVPHLVFQHNENGKILLLQLDGSLPVDSYVLDIDASDRRVVAISDFYGEGKKDIICQKPDGNLQVLKIEGGIVKEERDYPARSAPAPGWNIIGAGKFHSSPPCGYDDSGPGKKCDLVSVNEDGSEKISVIHQDQLRSEYLFPPSSAGKKDTIVAVGDINDDGADNFIRKRVDGSVYAELLKGFKIMGSYLLLGPGGETFPPHLRVSADDKASDAQTIPEK